MRSDDDAAQLDRYDIITLMQPIHAGIDWQAANDASDECEAVVGHGPYPVWAMVTLCDARNATGIIARADMQWAELEDY